MYVSRTDSAYIYHKWNDGLHIICCKKLPGLIIKLLTLEYIHTTKEESGREREIMSIRDLHIFLLFCTSIWLKWHRMLRNRFICFYKFKMCEWFIILILWFLFYLYWKKFCQSHFLVQFRTFRNPDRFSECFSNWFARNGQCLVQKELWIYS